VIQDPEDLSRRHEQKLEREKARKTKDMDVFKTVEEVLDKRTVMVLYQAINKGPLSRIFGVVKAGKEARIYWAEGKKGEDLAIKIYLTSSMEFKKSMLQYIEGDPRFRVGRDYRQIVYTWAQKEYRNLMEAHAAGVSVPKPLYVQENVVVMEFIGEGGEPAPVIKTLPKDQITAGMYEEVMDAMGKLYRKANLVHGDLSEYNIMLRDGRTVLIDFGQAVTREHPMAEELLKRDVGNVIRFFGKAGIDVPSEEEVLECLRKQ
jgi:RIO kinase 1